MERLLHSIVTVCRSLLLRKRSLPLTQPRAKWLNAPATRSLSVPPQNSCLFEDAHLESQKMKLSKAHCISAQPAKQNFTMLDAED